MTCYSSYALIASKLSCKVFVPMYGHTWLLLTFSRPAAGRDIYPPLAPAIPRSSIISTKLAVSPFSLVHGGSARYQICAIWVDRYCKQCPWRGESSGHSAWTSSHYIAYYTNERVITACRRWRTRLNGPNLTQLMQSIVYYAERHRTHVDGFLITYCRNFCWGSGATAT